MWLVFSVTLQTQCISLKAGCIITALYPFVRVCICYSQQHEGHCQLMVKAPVDFNQLALYHF